MPDFWMDVDAALSEVPVNILPLIDDTDFKSRETSIVYNQAGMDLVWNFVTTAGAYTQTAVTPTTAGDYDWTNQGDGMYSIEIPASGGASINNDTEGFGWFTGFCTGVLPWRGPTIGFRAAGLNNVLIDSAYSATRGLAGTALPDAAADAAGGLPISDLGGLDLDTQIGTDIDAILTDTADMQPKLGTITDLGSGATVGANLVDIEAQTDDIGAAGAGLTAIPYNSAWDADIESEVTDALNAYDPPTKAELDSGLAGLNDPTAATIADAVWDELATGHTDAGKAGEQLWTDVDAILADTNELQTDDVPTLIAALPTAAENRAEMDSNSTQLAAIVADTNELQGDWTDTGRLDTILDAIVADTNELQTDDVPGLIAALNNLSAAQVNAEVLDVLNTDTFAEPTGVPGATVTLATKIGYLYMALRNKITVTSTKKTYFDDGDAAEWEKDLSDDGSTYTESEGNAI